MLDFGYYNLDCMKGMAEFPDKYFDLAVVDPPYGIHQSGSKNKTRSHCAKARDYKDFYGNDASPPPKEYFIELFRVAKKQIIFGANHFIDNLPEPRNSPSWLVWDKNNGSNDFADCELAWANVGGAVRLFRYTWHGMLQEDMKNKEVRLHPSQKPVALYKWIFGKYAKRGDKILDTHVGSASSLIASYDLGLNFVGFELDEYYYKLSKERLDKHMAQHNLFVDFPEVLGDE